jgi:restriction endonuclease S subunit
VQVSNVRFQKLNPEFRIDAEYYRAEILNRLHILEQHKKESLDGLVDFVIGPFGSTVTVDKYVNESEYRYIRNKDINDFLIKDNEPALIPKAVYDSLPHFHIKENDLLITVVGTLGKVAIATNEDTKSIFSCKSTIIRARKINQFYLLAYLNSNTGRLFSLRGKRGAIQEGLNLSDLKEIQIFIPSDKFQLLIESIIKQSFGGTSKSKTLYNQAQTLLLSELGLINWQPKHNLSFVKNYSDADKAGRFDAEYFQPKYDEILKAIRNYPGGYSFVGKEFKQNKSVFNSNDTQTYQYVEIGSINVSTGEIVASDVLGAELPANAKRVLKKNDVIVSKVRTYRGAMALVDQDGLIGSGAFTVLRENGQINKETLLAFLRSKPLLAWSLKPNTGTSYPVILDDDILNLPIPLFSEKTQNTVKQKITESFNLRRQSKHLLECAKRAVEIAIEQNEDAAIKWLQEQTKEAISCCR